MHLAVVSFSLIIKHFLKHSAEGEVRYRYVGIVELIQHLSVHASREDDAC